MGIIEIIFLIQKQLNWYGWEDLGNILLLEVAIAAMRAATAVIQNMIFHFETSQKGEPNHY